MNLLIRYQVRRRKYLLEKGSCFAKTAAHSLHTYAPMLNVSAESRQESFRTRNIHQ